MVNLGETFDDAEGFDPKARVAIYSDCWSSGIQLGIMNLLIEAKEEGTGKNSERS